MRTEMHVRGEQRGRRAAQTGDRCQAVEAGGLTSPD
jgi:hypothetical protein